ncbi:phosphoribosylformylglycinamidine synthase [Caldicellulosiruptor bescii]|jgi:phosphoribosylformylglycinamidine synthase|uniref:Phosphoribosylformylglycinamidine synthase subunit PurQ n=2 Tax=Caldicellulosiruptor bescii TaxID=31899 RepID=B9MS94_CALBD|nr:phosphoribosylformylglycinamidine synthase subunit PurQ [Caldicellulosiruptor bescii]ACM60548.1 phosphoribosylformylglycinamidine synthase I [Caldicellulosiruptor bescii DSM 6725]PBC87959.1 phosphoribosylformylglycinamidine synthase [Caldicellulosiruptor bescii]PBC90891.1 phosphoribosylformylglycinamidine synthase [Caldicellulosiruptor bescii]PBD03677.1 phosphoribosylformylglycinamidine synthase [Caldicellulosiruptor bescii]PBD06689.1 phosphoribosylformylglycinamidine synthase [Caldicellulo
MKFGVVVFPGSNCDSDCFHVIKDVINEDVEYIWHDSDEKLKGFDCIILPGGFSYGDYLRAGAIARFSKVMPRIEEFAHNGGLVIGICNGFQILTESHLLPGALIRNKSLKFICSDQYVKVVNNNTPFTNLYKEGEVINLPIAHGEGNYVVDEETLKQMIQNQQIVLQYCDKYGNVNDETNPNGSILNIAGICNKEKNVFGLMPHPERSSERILGCEDGKRVFLSIVNYLKSR